MKKTEKVSIGRYAFTFDESAYEIVNNYLNELERYYLSQDGGAEIMEGIEERIAELLRERFSTDKIINEMDIEKIINIIGKPEAIEEESGSKNTKKVDNRFRYNSKRRLYRDLSNKVIGGVCSGLASYFDIDLLLVRIIFILLFLPGLLMTFSFLNIFSIFFPVPILYLVLWACIPAAKTAKQRWEMRGENGSLDDICRNIENGANEMGEFAKKVGNSNVGRAIGRVLAIIIGVFLLLLALGGLGFMSIILFKIGTFGYHNVWIGSIQSTIAEFPNSFDISGILLLFILLTPLVILIYGSILLIFNLKSPKFKPGLILFILWLFSIIAMFINIFTLDHKDISNDINRNFTITETITTKTNSDTIDIDTIIPNAKMIRTTIIKNTQSHKLEKQNK